MPFMGSNRTLLDEEYAILDPTHWSVTDPQGVVSVSGGKLAVSGGTGTDGGTCVTFAEQIELGGTMTLQHGDFTFDSVSTGVLGGLYANSIMAGSCLAGFQVTPAGSGSRIQALLDGIPAGPFVATQAGHRYVLTTRLYASEVYRQQQLFHSSAHAAGEARGGAPMSADVRVVLEVHEIDSANPGTLVAASTVLYDGVLTSAPGFCTYAPVNAIDLHCAIAFTRILRAANAEVRSALPGQNYRTRLAGSLSEGADCKVSTEPALQFFPQSMPVPNEFISVHYRGSGRALARVSNPDSIAASSRNGDDGVRATVRNMKAPSARTAGDCAQAALAILDDAAEHAWSGEYDTWSDFLPGTAEDIFPGDALGVNAPSRGAVFVGIVREVEVAFADLSDDRSLYRIRFADDAADPLAMQYSAGLVTDALDLRAEPVGSIGSLFLPDLTRAEIILPPGSTSVSMDAGIDPVSGGGIEVRWSDIGWGQDNDRNLVGRFSSRNITAPRLGRVQSYYLRQYDRSTPPRYSRYSAALHVDFPL